MNMLKAGIIIDSLLLPTWIVRAIELITSSEYAELGLVILNEAPQPVSVPFLYAAYRKRDSKRVLSAPDALALKDASATLSGIVQLHKADLTGMEQPVDIMISFSNNEIGAAIYKLSRHGVWSYFFGNAANEAAHGIWEVLGSSTIRSGIHSQTADGTKKTIYQSYGLADPASLKVTLNRCYWKSATFASRMLKTIAVEADNFTSITIADESNGRAWETGSLPPSNFSFLSAFVRNTAKRVIRKLKRLSVRRDWVLMYDTNSYTGKPFSAKDFKQLSSPPGFFRADPVVVERQGVYYLFIEEHVYTEGKARIIVIETDGQGTFSEPRVVLDKPYHLSYPFVFEHEGKHYMIPESADNNTVDLYEATDFPYQWKLKRNLLNNIIAVDTTVLYHNNKWWLFMNVEENRGAASMDELNIFYTDDIFNSKLNSHPQNPVISDVRSARPAGALYIKEGTIHRPSQVCAPYYGWGISINKVNEITEQAYAEEPLESIAPDASYGMAGIHTISHAGTFCVVDALVDVKK